MRVVVVGAAVDVVVGVRADDRHGVALLQLENRGEGRLLDFFPGRPAANLGVRAVLESLGHSPVVEPQSDRTTALRWYSPACGAVNVDVALS